MPALSQRAGREGRLQCSQELSEQLEGHTVTHALPSLHSPSAITSMHTRKFGSRLRKLRERQEGVWGPAQSRAPHQHTQGMLKPCSAVTRLKQMEQQEKQRRAEPCLGQTGTLFCSTGLLVTKGCAHSVPTQSNKKKSLG